MSILPDLLTTDLNLVFCGTAASKISARESAYYANPGNDFWRNLYKSGLTPHQIEPQNFRCLLKYKIGLTDIAKHASGNDADLTQSDFDADNLRKKIEQYQPCILAFTSKKAASEFFKIPTGKLSYGEQKTRIIATRIWILTSPSGAARRYADMSIWQALADEIGKMNKP